MTRERSLFRTGRLDSTPGQANGYCHDGATNVPSTEGSPGFAARVPGHSGLNIAE